MGKGSALALQRLPQGDCELKSSGHMGIYFVRGGGGVDGYVRRCGVGIV